MVYGLNGHFALRREHRSSPLSRLWAGGGGGEEAKTTGYKGKLSVWEKLNYGF